MVRFIPAVDVEPPSVDPGGLDAVGVAETVFNWIGDHPVPIVLLVFAILLAKWLTKPFMKGLIIGCLIAALVVFALGG